MQSWYFPFPNAPCPIYQVHTKCLSSLSCSSPPVGQGLGWGKRAPGCDAPSKAQCWPPGSKPDSCHNHKFPAQYQGFVLNPVGGDFYWDSNSHFCQKAEREGETRSQSSWVRMTGMHVAGDPGNPWFSCPLSLDYPIWEHSEPGRTMWGSLRRLLFLHFAK